ncbi:hypothetical protein GCM10009654_28130 [Streptomyces hebeiensis]|uniref:Uncharacterized protein n=1 Tax=Streptomyces hebeiensis TaxID=229486 RepID=A0ABN1UX63_9ACTN
MQLMYQAMALREETLSSIHCCADDISITWDALRDMKEYLRSGGVTAARFSSDLEMSKVTPPLIERSASGETLDVRTSVHLGRAWQAMSELAYTSYGERELFYRTGYTGEELEAGLRQFGFS